MEKYGEICDCIKSSEDKEEILIILDNAVRLQDKEISHINEEIEHAQILMQKEDKNSDFYFAMKDSIDMFPRLRDLHEDYKVRLKVLRKKLEDTKVC